MIKFAVPLAVGFWAICANSYGYNEWNINATSCVADAGLIQGNLYLGTGGTVKFASGKTGDIVLYCPVLSLGFTPSVLGLTYYDDSSVAGNHVTDQLINMEQGTGALTSIVTIDSNSGSVTSGGKAGRVAHEFRDNYDPKNFAYYLRIDIIRNSTTANETAYALALQE